MDCFVLPDRQMPRIPLFFLTDKCHGFLLTSWLPNFMKFSSPPDWLMLCIPLYFLTGKCYGFLPNLLIDRSSGDFPLPDWWVQCHPVFWLAVHLNKHYVLMRYFTTVTFYRCEYHTDFFNNFENSPWPPTPSPHPPTDTDMWTLYSILYSTHSTHSTYSNTVSGSNQRPCITRLWDPVVFCLTWLGADWKSGGGGSCKGCAVPSAYSTCILRAVELWYKVYSSCGGGGLRSDVPVSDHDWGRPMEVNACILTTHMVYL
jgi:hypothetical protein